MKTTDVPYRAALWLAFSIALILVLPCAARAQTSPTAQYPFQNPKLPIAQRVDNLVSRMTLAEKVSQMRTDAPAIPRLGVPAYYWWSECLHGDLANPATVFPEPIGLAATWDIPLESRIATAVSDEDCAHYNETLAAGKPQPLTGLTFFAPNINIFRDPRWGRGQETYGEDPYLTAQFGVAFVKGLQGDNPRYLKVISTPKHFAVHSGPEPMRHRFDAEVSDYDLFDTYLPAFAACVTQGHAGSVMGAYSSLDGIPDNANPRLLGTILRDRWGFKGYVVSDCGAIGDIYWGHHYANSLPEAAALAVKAGCDLSCGTEYDTLVDAVHQGLITETQIDRSVKRLFTARLRLGMFDPPSMVPYRSIPASVIDSEAHRALARAAARESIVLLKNDKDFLPLSSSIKSIAVIGPNADSAPPLLGNYNGAPSHAVTVLEGLSNACADRIRLEYVQGCALLNDDYDLALVPESALSSNGQPGLNAKYFANQNLQGQPALVRQDDHIAFNWDKVSPAQNFPRTQFSVRWTGSLTAPQTGQYTLGVRGDDGFRLFIGGNKVIDDWNDHAAEIRSCQVKLTAGQPVAIRVEYYQNEGDAEVSLLWKKQSNTPPPEALSAARRADAVIFVGGYSPQLEGEEGTNGNGDRPDIVLPALQENLIKSLVATGKPVVVVLLNGSALASTWCAAHVPAILDAWYPGEEGGNAVADVLFGRYNPAGRLPVTFYRSLAQLPAFTDYSMKGRTYRYFEGDPLYPFGYGLSYTRFAYRRLAYPTQVRPNRPVAISAQIENVGGRAGDEVAELYLRPDPKGSHRWIAQGQPMPRLILAGFSRVHLAPHERRTVTFTLKPEQILLLNAHGMRALQPGAWEIFVGGRQPDLAHPQSAGVLSGTIHVR